MAKSEQDWTLPEDATLERWWRAGESIEEMAEAFACSKAAVCERAAWLGLEPRTQPDRPNAGAQPYTHWMPREDAMIREHLSARGAAWCAAQTGRTLAAVRARATLIGATHPTWWTPGEDATLSRMYPSAPWPELLRAIPGHTRDAIARRAQALGLRRVCYRQKWTEDERAILREHYATRGPGWCARELGRSAEAVTLQAHRMGVQRTPRYSDEDVRRLRELWPDHTSAQIGEEIGRSARSVRNKIARLREAGEW